MSGASLGVSFKDKTLTFNDGAGGSFSISDAGAITMVSGGVSVNLNGTSGSTTYSFGFGSATISSNGNVSLNLNAGPLSGNVTGTIDGSGASVTSASFSGSVDIPLFGPVGVNANGSFDWTPDTGWQSTHSESPTIAGKPLGQIAEDAGNFLEDAIKTIPVGAMLANRDAYLRALEEAYENGGDPEAIRRSYNAGLKPAVSSSLGTNPDPLVKTIRYVDPLVLDLDGDGLEITSLAQGILFDANGDSIKTGTAWVGADDGLLVWDRNGNGLIDSGTELFGDESILANGQKAAHGFAALSDIDKGSLINGVIVGAGDGVFDIKDSNFSNVRVWRDLNQDGVSQANELKTLAESGIQKINLGSSTVNISYGDAQLVQSSTFTRNDATIGQAGSFILAQNNFIRSFTPIPISNAAKALPDIKGTGWVRDLQEAASQNPSLINSFNLAKNATTRLDYRNAIAALIRDWGNNSDYVSASKDAASYGYGLILSDPQDSQELGWMDEAVKAGEAECNSFRATLSIEDLTKFDAMRERMVGGLENLYAYEAFTGHTFLQWGQVYKDATQYTPRANVTNGGRSTVEVWVPFSTIILQNQNGQMSGIPGYIDVNIPKPPSGTPHLETLWNRIVDDVAANLMPTLRLSKYIDLIDVDFDTSGLTVDLTSFNAALSAAFVANTHDGTTLILDLYRSYGDDLVRAGWNGLDQIRTLAHQRLTNIDIDSAFTEVGIFSSSETSGTETDDIYAGTVNGDVFNAGGGNDLLDGLEGNDVLDGGTGNDKIFGGSGLDILSGGDGDDLIDGEADNDILSGGYGNDLVQGGDGDDVINDDNGANTLIGGSGNDTINGAGTMEGGLGDDVITAANPWSSDTYIFNLGDGKDTITDWNYGGYTDTLKFGAGITSDMISLSHVGNDMVFNINNNDQITVKGWFSDSGYYLENVQFTDNTVWDLNQLRSMAVVLNGTSLAETLNGWDGVDSILGGDGNDTINGGGGNDTLLGAAGADSLSGGYGNDLVQGGDGDDVINDDNGANTLIGGSGNDTINGAGTMEGGLGDDVITAANPWSSDTYIFNLGDGKDTITDWNYGGYTDTLKFGAGITSDMISLSHVGNDMVFNINNNDQITVKGWFSDSGYYLENFQFADNTVWDLNQLKSMVVVLKGTSLAETLNGGEGNDVIDGGNGNDTINGGGGNDTLLGAAGADSLSGGYGNDLVQGGDGDDVINDDNGANTLIGGSGNDTINGAGTMEGGLGDDVITAANPWSSDTYIFNLGDGKDTITDWNYGGYTDTLKFGAGITSDMISLSHVGNDMVFNINNNDQITVKGWFSDSGYYLENVQFTDNTVWDLNQLRSMAVVLNGTSLAETLNGWDGVDSILGGDGNDTINGGGGNDTLLGAAGADSLSGGYGNDLVQGGDGDDVINDDNGANTLIGGSGNDTINGAGTMEGGLGDDVITAANPWSSDTYIFNLGDGKDTITDWNYGGYTDTLKFGAGITSDMISLSHVGNDMVFNINNNDQITVKGWFSDSGYYLENFQFADNTVWDLNQLKSMVVVLKGTSLAETLNGGEGNDVIDGGNGNDTINGGGGSDTLLGSAGNDVLSGGYGNDLVQGGDGDDAINDDNGENTLVGGSGNDTINGAGTMEGGLGDDVITAVNPWSSDTYIFNLGDGKDTITDWNYNGYTDTVQFGAGVSIEQLWFRHVDNNLEATIVGTTDKLVINNWYSGEAYHVEQFKTSDGKVMLDSQVEALISAMASFAPPNGVGSVVSQEAHDQLQSVLAASWH